MKKKAIKNVGKSYTHPKTGKFVKGNPGGGRPPGTRNFETDFNEAVKDIAKLNKISVSEARKTLLKKAYGEAKDGNFNFWQYIHDRIYGKVKERVDLTSGDKPIPIFGNALPDNNSDSQDSGSQEED